MIFKSKEKALREEIQIKLENENSTLAELERLHKKYIEQENETKSFFCYGKITIVKKNIEFLEKLLKL